MIDEEKKPKAEVEKPPIEAVIFDLDGLLIDSEPLWSEGRRQILAQYGVAYTMKEKKMTMGGDYRTGVAYLVKHYNLPLTIDEYAEREKQLLDRLYKQGLQLMPGVVEFFDKLDQVQIAKAIATSSSRKRLNMVMKLVRLGSFDAIVTGDEIRDGKPAPDIFLKVAEKLNIDPETCVVLEDSPLGIMAARAAGMKTVAIYDSRFTSEEDFQSQSKPDLIVNSLRGLDIEKLGAMVK